MPSRKNSPPWAPPSNGSADPPEENAPDRVFLRPLIPLALAFAAGIVAGDAGPGFRAAGWAAALPAAGWTVHRWRKNRPVRFSPLLLFLALGYLAIQPWVSPRFPPDHVVRIADGEYHRIEGRLIESPEDRFRGFRFVLEAERVDGRPVSGRIRAGAGEESARPESGDRVALTGRLKRIRSFRNPGGFDYERFMAFRGLFVSTWARKNSLRIVEDAPSLGPVQRRDRFRSRLSRAIRRAVPGEAGAVLRALTVGDRDGVSPELRDRFAEAGVAHLLAISGLHVGIVTGVGFFLFRRLLVWIPGLLRRGWLDRTASLLALGPVLAYGILSGGSPSVRRAAGTAVLVLAAVWMRRRPDPASILALVAFAILAFHPPALFAIGFQLSFAAVGAILLGMSAVTSDSPEERSPGFRARRWAIGMAWVSVFAVWATLPLTMRYFNQAVFVGLVSNFLFIPLVGFGAVPCGLAGAILFPFLEPVARLLFQTGGFPIHLGLKAVSFFAALPFGAFRTVTPTIPEIAAYYVFGVGAILLWRTDPESGGKVRKRVKAFMAAGLLFFAGDIVHWTHQRFGRGTLRVTAVDVGQGTATLLEFPRGPAVLVDGGGFYDNRIFDVGERIVAPILWRKRILTLDAVVLSHADSDHYNGLRFVLEHFRVGQFWTPDPDAPGAGMDRVRDILRRREIPIVPFAELARSREFGEARMEILHPPATPPASAGNERWRAEDNNRSLVLRVALGNVSFLLPGDIEAEAEAALVASVGDRLRSTVLLAPHHASRTSSSPGFVAGVDPALMVASAGAGNPFGCPAPEVMARYWAIGCRTLRTDRNGAVEMETDGFFLRVRPRVPPKGIPVDIPRGLP